MLSLRRNVYAPPAPKMPPGLVELMDGLARDVLRNNPENINEFCARHMQTLLEIRDGYAPKPFITLNQKIAKAQKIVKQREEERRREYDEKFNSISTDTSNIQGVITQSNVPCDVNNSEYSEKKEVVKELSSDLAPTKVHQNDVSTDKVGDITNNEGNLDSAPDKEVEENTENVIIGHQDPSNVNHSEENENNILSKEVHQITEGKNTNDVLDNNVAEEATKDEIQSLDLELGTNNVNDEIEVIESMTKFESTEATNSVTNEAVVTIQHISDSQLESERLESIDQNSKETQNKIEVDINIMSDEKTFANNEKADDFVAVVASSNITKDQHSNDEKIGFEEINKDLDGNQTKQLKESEKPKEDDQILAIILSTKPLEFNSDHKNQTDNTPEDENQQKINEIFETSDNITHNINNSMDLETAAVTIQKVFRSFLFKTKTASYDDPTAVDMNLLNEDKEKEDIDGLNMNLKDRRPLGITRMDTVLQTVNEEKSLSLSTDDSSTLSSAATIIQAHVRGFLVRNKLNLNKTASSNSLIDSDAPSIPSLEADSDNRKSKTILNIHIVPEGGHFVSRDESVITSMDLSLDSSPPSSVNLHPLGYDKSERRKQLKREDAIQSVSPPSNNSGKLSDDIDSVKEVLIDSNNSGSELPIEGEKNIGTLDNSLPGNDKLMTETENSAIVNPVPDAASDEMDVVSPFIPAEGRSSRESSNSSKLLHSGEFHDVIVPTNVTRSDTSVVREFQNVLVYFILWNN